MRLWLFLFAAVMSMAALAGCFHSGTGSAGNQGLGYLESTSDYSVAGDSIHYRHSGEGLRFCTSDSLFTIPGGEGLFGEKFSLTGDSLIQVQEFFTPDSGAFIRYQYTSIRIGDATGLDGTWKVIDESYAVISGALTPDDKRTLDRISGKPREAGVYWQRHQVFSAGKHLAYREWHRAVEFLDDWNGLQPNDADDEADSSRYSIQVRILGNSTVELHGLKTLESVRVEMQDNGDRIYTSSRKDHSRSVYYYKPSGCPNPFFPDWYSEFLVANLKAPI